MKIETSISSILKILIIVILVILVLHYKKYKEFTEEYKIEQQELDYVKPYEINNNLNPLVITFIEEISLKENAMKYKLYTPLSLKQVEEKVDDSWYEKNRYIEQKHDTFLIRPEKECKISLINPKYKNLFKKMETKDNGNVYEGIDDNFKEVKEIDIIIRDYNILYIPRHWLFHFEDKNNCTIFYSSSLLSKVYQL